MIAEIEKVVLKIIESVYQDSSYKYTLSDNFPESGFRSEDSNKILDSRVAVYKYRNID